MFFFLFILLLFIIRKTFIIKCHSEWSEKNSIAGYFRTRKKDVYCLKQVPILTMESSKFGEWRREFCNMLISMFTNFDIFMWENTLSTRTLETKGHFHFFEQKNIYFHAFFLSFEKTNKWISSWFVDLIGKKQRQVRLTAFLSSTLSRRYCKSSVGLMRNISGVSHQSVMNISSLAAFKPLSTPSM